MAIDVIIKRLELSGYSNIKKSTNNRAILYTSDDRRSELNNIAQIIGGKYTSARTGSGWKSSAGAVLINQDVIIAKPITKGTSGNVASLDARVFSVLGEATTFNYNGNDIKCVKFTSANKIRDSIIRGIKSSSLLGENYVEMFQSFFDTGKIEWDPNVSQAVINKLGVYIGELLIGWVFLSKTQSKYFKNKTFTGSYNAFYLPTDPSFSGVDSFVSSDKDYISISSKFGRGAKASIFSNLLKSGITKIDVLTNSIFKDLCKVAKTNNLSYTQSRSIVYHYGIRNILKIPNSKLKNPDDVYTQIRAGSGTDLNTVVEAILKSNAPQEIKSKLPYSISSYFNRTIAEQLNSDQNSIQQIINILEGKEYWQANLNLTEWQKGTVSFNLIKSGKAKLKIYGNKSAIEDFTSKQGWINYELS